MALSEGFKGQSSASAMRLTVRAEAFQGLADVQGMLMFDGTTLRLEFQTSDALFGVLRSAPKQVEIPLASIEAVRSGRGWWWLMPFIEIELNDFTLLSRVPGAQDGQWRLRVRWRDRLALKRFASALAFARSGDLHHRLNVGLEARPGVASMPELPPLPEQHRTPPPLPERHRTPPRQTED